MLVKPDSYKKLVAIDANGKFIKIPNMVMRKPLDSISQKNKISHNSVCIVCDYSFLEKRITWTNNIGAICHPFKKDNIFPSGINKFLFSESDFCDKILTPAHDPQKNKWKGKYDFVYFSIDSVKGVKCKGLHMLEMIYLATSELGLRGLVIFYSLQGTKKIKSNSVYYEAYKKISSRYAKLKNINFIRKKYDQKSLNLIMKAVKFVLVPSIADASPRIITEALVRNVPVVLNSSIYGGWKYIDENTGSFFNGISAKEYLEKKDNYSSMKISIEKAMQIDKSNIAAHFYRKYGFYNSARRLANIINQIDGSKYLFVSFEEWSKKLKKIT